MVSYISQRTELSFPDDGMTHYSTTAIHHRDRDTRRVTRCTLAKFVAPLRDFSLDLYCLVLH